MIGELLKLHPNLYKIVKIYDKSVHGTVTHKSFWNYT